MRHAAAHADADTQADDYDPAPPIVLTIRESRLLAAAIDLAAGLMAPHPATELRNLARRFNPEPPVRPYRRRR